MVGIPNLSIDSAYLPNRKRTKENKTNEPQTQTLPLKTPIFSFEVCLVTLQDMGNTHTKEARSGSRFGPNSALDAGGSSGGAGYQGDQPDRSRRASRVDIASLGLLTGGGSSSRHDAPFEHRETKQEREARRLEKERVARAKERDRSIKEENVDGGYLVTMGIYSASEDFSKPVVRQLQVRYIRDVVQFSD